ncbi:MAG: hypothetical protein ABI689_02920 [Thermoanaerobaculia bacterium]
MSIRSGCRPLLLALGLAAALPAGAAAQWDGLAVEAVDAPGGTPVLLPNLFPRGEFDSAADVAGWTSTTGIGQFDFNSAADADNCLDSGSSTVTANEPLAGTLYRTAICGGAIAGGQSYVVGLQAFFPVQADSGDVVFRIGWYPGPNCTSLPVQVDLFNPLASSATGYWQRASALLSTPPAAVSFAVSLTLNKTTAGSLSVDVDRIFVQPENSIFLDSFQIGDGGETCRWSVPDQL